MDEIRVTLFGRLRIERGGESLRGFQPRKVRELFCFLLLQPDHPHGREKLASTIFGENCTTVLSRKYLRNALWRLQSALDRPLGSAESPLVAEREWIEFKSTPLVWTDVNLLKEAYERCREMPELDTVADLVDLMDAAIECYTAPLLEAWDYDWCATERAEHARMYLDVLEKRMAFCEETSDFERGISMGHRLLREDSAHEPTHQRMMRMYYLVGDRTRALRQFEVCAEAMKSEFDASPAKETVALHDLIASDPQDGRQLARLAARRGRDPFSFRPQTGAS